MTNATDHADASVANRTRLSALKVAEPQELAVSLGIVGASKRRKGELVELISARQDGDVAADGSAAASAPAPVLEAPAEAFVADAPSFDEAHDAPTPSSTSLQRPSPRPQQRLSPTPPSPRRLLPQKRPSRRMPHPLRSRLRPPASVASRDVRPAPARPRCST